MNPLPTILYVDHDLAFRSLLRERIASWGDVRFLAATDSHARAISLYRHFHPTVVVSEVQLHEGDGLELCAVIKQESPSQKVVLVAEYPSDYLVYQVAQGLVDGLIWKIQTAVDDLRSAVRFVSSGTRYLPVGFASLRAALWARPNAFFKILSKWEMELMRYFGKGLPDAEISLQLGIAKATVRTHRYQIMARLGLHSSSALKDWAIGTGFVTETMLHAAPPCVLLSQEVDLNL